MALKLGEAMLKDSLITKEQLRLALERQVIFGGRLGTNLIELGILREGELAAFLSKYFRVPSVEPAKLASIDQETVSCMSRAQAEKYKAMPFQKDRNRLHVAMIDPRSMTHIDEMRFSMGYDIIPYVITELRLLYAHEKYYGVQRDLRYISIFGKEEETETSKDKHLEHLTKVKEEFANAKNREEIISIILNEAKSIAKRTGIFVLKGDKVVGWKSKSLNIENVEITPATPSVFSDVINKKNYYRGPLLRIPGNEQLISLLNGTPQDCIMLPIQIREKVIGLLYADNGNTSVLDASLTYFNTLVTMASLSFEIVIMRNKILAL